MSPTTKQKPTRQKDLAWAEKLHRDIQGEPPKEIAAALGIPLVLIQMAGSLDKRPEAQDIDQWPQRFYAAVAAGKPEDKEAAAGRFVTWLLESADSPLATAIIDQDDAWAAMRDKLIALVDPG